MIKDDENKLGRDESRLINKRQKSNREIMVKIHMRRIDYLFLGSTGMNHQLNNAQT